MKLFSPFRTLSAGLCSAALFFIIVPLAFGADSSAFRDKFLGLYEQAAFKEVERLIKGNKAIVLKEARTILEEAKQDRPFEEKMFLINLSNKLALFYQDYFEGGDDLIEELKKYQKKIVLEDEEKNRKLMKWKNLEKIPGNFVLKKNMAQMKEKGLSPVLFPHWLHRTLFSCKVCHDEIFEMDRWTNAIVMEKIKKKQLCGACHNDTIAFGVNDDNCIRCHMAGTDKAEHLHNIKKIDHERIKNAAKRLGAQWHPEKIAGGKLPVDRFGFIDWVELRKKGVVKPLQSFDKEAAGEVKENKILIRSKSPAVRDILFDHKTHSSVIRCSSCHPAQFKEELGANKMNMKAIAQGRFCGYCHGKVSFTFKDCVRCHNVPKGGSVEGALIH